MGVEQLIRDRFQAAKEYERAWKEWDRSKKGIPPRRDLELDALVEIVNGTRLIHAHSYRQDEIVALIRVAEDFGIRIATLQHILEGYKVADVIAKHGAGASGFSDWWSYKWEAYEAIPGALPLMHKQGVLISYNSDDSQLATRLNWEAAKGIEFGLSEEEVLAAVTINPARQLHIDKYVGSLEPGKDADIALWSGNPLSTASKCVQTWVDGRRMFDIEEDLALQKQAATERAALIQKILKEKRSGPSSGGAPPTLRRPNEVYLQSCSSEENDHE
jgi:N-acetylglucosamine-6-phosphate deacetylase